MNESDRLPTVATALTDHAIDVELLRAEICHPDAGSQLVFLGCTRRMTNDQQTAYLVYEAYRSMAMIQLQEIGERAAEKWALKRVRIVHRLGRVDIGEASIAVGISSPHRAATFAAVAWIMDEVKRDVTIWKEDHWQTGSSWVHRES